MTIDSVGNLGLGTSSPSATCHITSLSETQLKIDSTTDGKNSMIVLSNVSGKSNISIVGRDGELSSVSKSGDMIIKSESNNLLLQSGSRPFGHIGEPCNSHIYRTRRNK